MEYLVATNLSVEHKTKVNELQTQLRSNENDPVYLKKSTTNLFRHRNHGNGRRLDTRNMNQVLNVDSSRLLLESEGMTTFANAVDATLPHGCLPNVVPELKSITIGGALTGLGIESSSFRYGLVHETIEEFDVLLSSGDIVTCRADNEHHDLFYGFPNSYGTLGYAMRIVSKLIHCKPYVKLTHIHFDNAIDYFKTLERLCLDNYPTGKIDYIEGVIFSPKQFVITCGEFVSEAPYTSDYKYMKIYYKSLLNRKEDFLTTKDYIWRWDTDWFWCSKNLYFQNPAIRLLFGRFCLNSITYRKIMHQAMRNPVLKLFNNMQKPKETVVQDVVIPADHAIDFYNFYQDKINIYPCWNCPTMPYHKDITNTLFKQNPKQLYFNFGFWDMVETDEPIGTVNRALEHKVREVGGNKSLYSNVFYTEEEFWAIHNKSAYDQLKQKYDPKQVFVNLFDKCNEKRI